MSSPSQDSNDLYEPPVLNAATCWALAEKEGAHLPRLDLGRPKDCSGFFPATTLADLPRAPEDIWNRSKAQCMLDKNASQPQGTSQTRAAQALQIKQQRLLRTKKLNKYVPVLAGKCSVHLLEQRQIKPEHFPAPCSNLQTHRPAYNEGPECHKPYVPGSGQKCPFQFTIVKTAFVAGQRPELISGMQADLGVLGNTFKEYLGWASSEVEVDGRYHNVIEAFLWCWEHLEKMDPCLFL